MRNTQRLFLGMFLLVCLTSVQASSPRDPGQYFFDQSLGDFSEELELAKENGKKAILIMFEMDECPFCHRMKQTVLNQPEIQDYYKENFMVFSVDIEGDVEMTDFKGQVLSQKDFAFKGNRVRATPVFAFFDLNGDPIKGARFTGATNGPEEFMWLGEYVVDGVYNEMSFTRYKRGKKGN
ncbi:MAG: thioredoxin [Sedimenticola sp.]|nr:MAG: thioredoxin [Sedimenticola sp.]